MNYKTKKQLILFSGILGPVIYWFLESFIDATVFKKGVFIDNLVAPQAEELFMRLCILAGMISFSIFAYKAISKIEQQTKALEDANLVLLNKVEEKTQHLSLKVQEIEKLQLELKHQKDFLVNVLENLTVAAFIIDKQHKVLFWNRACERLTGIRAEDIIGTANQWQAFYNFKRPSLADIVLDGDCANLSALYQTYSKSVLSDKGLQAEGWYPKLGGEDRYIVFDAVPIFDTEGNVIAALETIQDLSTLKRLEERAKKDSDLVKGLMDKAKVAIFTYEENKFSFVNKYSEELIGYSNEELKQLNIWDVVHPEDRELVKERGLARQKGLEVPNSYEFRVIRKDGKVLWVDFSANLIDYGDRKIVLGTVYDITEKKKLEAQLIQSQKLEAIGRLAAGIAHDFNNILTAVIGYATILNLKMDKDDPLMPNVKNILNVCERATEIAQNLLTFSRQKTISPKKISLNSAILKLDKILRRLIGEDINFVLDLTKDDVMCFADEAQLQQVILNLTTNARDAMPNGGTLLIKTLNTTITRDFILNNGFGEVGNYGVIIVTDTGCGMDECTKKNIFEPFFTTKEAGKGTGLGLSMVYGIVKQHNGFINVISELGKGTTFEIYLPSCEDNIENSVDVECGKKFLDNMTGSEIILLAEDNDDVRKITKVYLQEFGYKVLEAKDGEEAVELYRKNVDKVALVILDVIMPKKNGREVLSEMEKINPNIKSIFVSGYTEEIIHQKGLLERGYNFISKPITPTEMLTKIKEVLKN